jgi:hypothetical protein
LLWAVLRERIEEGWVGHTVWEFIRGRCDGLNAWRRGPGAGCDLDQRMRMEELVEKFLGRGRRRGS